MNRVMYVPMFLGQILQSAVCLQARLCGVDAGVEASPEMAKWNHFGFDSFDCQTSCSSSALRKGKKVHFLVSR